MNQRFGITVKFLISADSPEEAEEIIESACEKVVEEMTNITGNSKQYFIDHYFA